MNDNKQNMKIKYATVNDLKQVDSLYQELASLMAEINPYLWRLAEHDLSFLKSVVEDDKSDIILATDGDKIVGYTLVQQLHTPPYKCYVLHDYALLLEIVVSKAQRGKGIGSLLMDEVKKWSSQRNLNYIDLNVLCANNSAIRLYEKNGFFSDMQSMKFKIKEQFEAGYD